MSKIGEFFAWQLNQIFPTLSIHRNLESAKSSIAANQAWSLAELHRIVKYFEPYWDLRGKNLLVIGTGVGGKLPFYYEAGARAVIGIDITPQNVSVSQQLIRDVYQSTPPGKIFSFSITDAARLPFPHDSFDAIISINVFEHIFRIQEAITETYRILKPGGAFYLHVPPYYGPWGPHLENWIHFPWPHLLFSDKTLLQVAAREDRYVQLNDRFFYATKVDWEAEQIPNVNKASLRRIQKLISQAGFVVTQLRLLPVGYEILQTNSNSIKNIIFRLLSLACHIPILQEAIVTKMVYVLTKAPEESRPALHE